MDRREQKMRRLRIVAIACALVVAGLLAGVAYAYTYNCVNTIKYDAYWGDPHVGVPGRFDDANLHCSGNAGDFDYCAQHAAVPRYAVNQTAEVGAIMVLHPSTCSTGAGGHVGIVVGWGPGSILVNEQAWGPNGANEPPGTHSHPYPCNGMWFIHPARGDLNRDNTVNIIDLSILISRWGRTNDIADLNANGIVDVYDLSILLTCWGYWTGTAGAPQSVPMVGQSEGLTAIASTGPTLAIGTPSVLDGQVRVPIDASAPGLDPYMAFNVHLRWDPTVFSFVDASASGGLFESGSICPNYILDPDGGGASFACAFSDAQGRTSTGLLATITLSAEATGCSRLQLETFGPPDGGDGLAGTLTVNAPPDIVAQTNQYTAGSVDANGQVCTPPPCVNHDSDSLCDDIDPDDDNDGLPDAVETNTGIFVDSTNTGTDPHNADSDSDGMPDGYEVSHSCLNPLASDATSDPDTDGRDNLTEYGVGSDPCVADPAVGGIAELPDLAGKALETGGSSGPGVGVLAAIAASAAAGPLSLLGAAWYARRRWLRHRA